MNELSPEIIERARGIKLLLMDCDGVLTDGRLYFSDNGDHLKAFHTRDGQGIVAWHAAGFRSGVISGRDSRALAARAEQLGMHYVVQGCVDKAAAFSEIIAKAGLAPGEAAFIGDDTPDLAAMKLAGFSIAVCDASSDVLAAADHVTAGSGGRGAVREVIELLLAANSK